MLMNRKEIEEALNGAWEEPGVIGTRIEIEGKKITVLWRNQPVLETTFEAEEKEGGIALTLKKTGLSYSTDATPYATVTGLFVHDGVLDFDEHFPITGPSRETLKKTALSRYGNVTICDEVLDELQGAWIDESGSDYFRVSFRGNKMTLTDNGTREVHAVRWNGYTSGEVRIIDADPSVYEWRGLGNMIYEGGRIRLQMFVCDAPPMYITFKRAE